MLLENGLVMLFLERYWDTPGAFRDIRAGARQRLRRRAALEIVAAAISRGDIYFRKAVLLERGQATSCLRRCDKIRQGSFKVLGAVKTERR